MYESAQMFNPIFFKIFLIVLKFSSGDFLKKKIFELGGGTVLLRLLRLCAFL